MTIIPPLVPPIINAGTQLNASTTAWINAVIAAGGTVGATEQTNVNNFIVGAKSDGFWTKLDRLWLHAIQNQTEALVDIVSDSLATAVNSPTFTANRGFTGQDLGSNAVTKYVNSGFNPMANGVNFLTNTCHISAWCVGNTASTNGGALMGCVGDVIIYDTFTDGNVYGRIIDTAANSGAPATRQGHWIANRSSSSASQLYQNGANFASPNAAVGTIPNQNLFITCIDQSGAAGFGTPNQVAMTSMGGNLSSTDASNLYTRLRTYMTAVGVP